MNTKHLAALLVALLVAAPAVAIPASSTRAAPSLPSDARAMLGALAAPGDDLEHAVSLAHLVTAQEARALGVRVQAPSLAGNELPSAAALALFAERGVSPSATVRGQLAQLDAAPAAVRVSLSRTLDAYAALDAATRVAYRAAHVGALKDVRAPTDFLSVAGLDLGPVLGARLALLDATLELRAALAGAPRATLDALPVVQQSPVVSIDLGTRDDLYSEDYAFLLDAGGNDTYVNNAGGDNLNRGSCSPYEEAGAAAALDLGGDDRYVSDQACGVNGGAMLGVGLLVDAGGNDVFLGGDQGANGGATFGGLGMLLDAGGSDTFNGTVAASNGGGALAVGALIHTGGGDDTYLAQAPTIYTPVVGGTNGGGFEAGLGALVDDGGNDTYLASDEGVNGGGATGAVGFLLDAAGNDRYVAGSYGANGGGYFGGAGALVDAGGNDTYVADTAGVNGGAESGISLAGPVGQGLLLDLGGADSYEDNDGGSGTDVTVVPKGDLGAQIDLGATGADAAPADLVVAFRALPAGLAPGNAFDGASVQRVDAALRFAEVHAADGAAFTSLARADPNVRYVERDGSVTLADTPNDPGLAKQYAPQQTRLDQAWNVTVGSPAITLCFVDTGVRYTHEDLNGSRYLGGVALYSQGGAGPTVSTGGVNSGGTAAPDDPWDFEGHGTHVAGIAAATINNGRGVAGAAQASFLAANVFGTSGTTTEGILASGIAWCADHGANIISMSVGGGYSAIEHEAVRYAADHGALIVAAAGNGGCLNCVEYPAAFPEVVAVTCTDATTAVCGFSSTGPEAELAAPGSNIWSTWAPQDVSLLATPGTRNTVTNSYAFLSGTSMSTPLVSGIAALVWSQMPNLSAAQVRQVLDATAHDLGPAGRDSYYGYGIVDAKAALDSLAANPPATSAKARTVFAESFDNGTQAAWTMDGLWHSAPAASCGTPFSGSGYLAFDQEPVVAGPHHGAIPEADQCNFDTGGRSAGNATANVDLTGVSSPRLFFLHQFAVESSSGVRKFDVMRVQASRDGGASWSTLAQWDSTSLPVATWTPVEIPLDSVAGGPIKLRFSFDSVDNQRNGYAGWQIDELSIMGVSG